MLINSNGKRYSVFLPIVLILVVLILMVAFRGIKLVQENIALRYSRDSQYTPIDEADKVRNQLDSIAKGMAELAQNGNRKAQLVVSELKKKGVVIRPESQPVVKFYAE